MENFSTTSISLDERGGLGVINLDEIPFKPERFFWIFNTPINTPRAGHGHTTCQQFLMALGGEIDIRVTKKDLSVLEISLRPGDCFHLETYNWLELLNFHDGAVLGVWASEKYDRSEYIETYEEFLAISK